jgi:hypothetical protein
MWLVLALDLECVQIVKAPMLALITFLRMVHYYLKYCTVEYSTQKQGPGFCKRAIESLNP